MLVALVRFWCFDVDLCYIHWARRQLPATLSH